MSQIEHILYKFQAKDYGTACIDVNIIIFRASGYMRLIQLLGMWWVFHIIHWSFMIIDEPALINEPICDVISESMNVLEHLSRPAIANAHHYVIF